jgi:hypothetical protein
MSLAGNNHDPRLDPAIGIEDQLLRNLNAPSLKRNK